MIRAVGALSPTVIARQLKGIDFPATKDDLIEQALDNGVASEVAEILEELPDREYDDMADVMDAYSDVREHLKTGNGGGEEDEEEEADELYLDQVYEEDEDEDDYEDEEEDEEEEE